MVKTKKSDIYISQKLEDTWSFDHYDKYKSAIETWNWTCLPFGEYR